MRNITIVTIALSIALTNVIISHYYGLPSLILIPVVVLLITALLAFGTRNIRIILVSILAFALIVLHDILLTWSTGGYGDSEEKAWIKLAMLAGLLPAFILLWATFARRKNETLFAKITALALFVVLMAAYLALGS